MRERGRLDRAFDERVMKNLGRICFIAALAFGGFACQSEVAPIANLQTPAPAERTDDAAQKLESVRRQGFNFVYVFRRRDGAPLDPEDRKYLRANSPLETNQWIISDDGRAAIAGSNFRFPPASLDALGKRFNVEDLSRPPETEAPANSNANS